MRCVISIFSLFLLLSCSSTNNNISTAAEPSVTAGPRGNTSISWKPNVLEDDFHVESIESFRNVHLSFKPLSDYRTAKESIGNINFNGQPKAIIPKDDIGLWCSKNLKNCCKFLGLEGATKTSPFSFEGEITDFSIMQDITMHARIGLSLSCNKDGLTVWEGSVEGNSELYVIPTGSDGISECLSNTLINAVYSLLNDKSFVDAVNKSKL